MKRSLTVLAVLVIVLVLVLACAKPAPAPAPSPAPEVKEVHFLQVNALTGTNAPYGTHVIAGTTVAAKRINDAGGFTDDYGNKYTIKLSEWDLGRAPKEEGIAGVRKAQGDPTILAVLGPSPSTGFLGMVPSAKEMKMIIIGAGTSAPVKEWNPYAFRVTVTAWAGAPKLAKVIKEQYDVKRMAILYDQTNDAAALEAGIFRGIASEVGFEIVADEAIRTGDVDMRPQITKIKAVNPDWVHAVATRDEATKMILQMYELGVLDMVKGTSNFAGVVNDPKYFELTGGKSMGQLVWTLGVDPKSTDPDAVAFREVYKQLYPDMEVNVFDLYGVQLLHLVVDVVKRSGTNTDRERFRDFLAVADVHPWAGWVKFSSPRDAPMGENLGGAVWITKVTGPDDFEILAK